MKNTAISGATRAAKRTASEKKLDGLKGAIEPDDVPLVEEEPAGYVAASPSRITEAMALLAQSMMLQAKLIRIIQEERKPKKVKPAEDKNLQLFGDRK